MKESLLALHPHLLDSEEIDASDLNHGSRGSVSLAELTPELDGRFFTLQVIASEGDRGILVGALAERSKRSEVQELRLVQDLLREGLIRDVDGRRVIATPAGLRAASVLTQLHRQP